MTPPDVWTSKRIETGPIQFGSDWPGVFLRGDYALWCAHLLSAMLQRSGGDVTLSGLASMLASCDARTDPKVRVLHSPERAAALEECAPLLADWLARESMPAHLRERCVPIELTAQTRAALSRLEACR